MKQINLIIIICLQFVFKIESQNYNSDLFLKDYSGDMIITTQVKAERNKAILKGTEAKKNRDFVLENYSGIQPSIYPAWDEGFWPKKKPELLKDFNFDASGNKRIMRLAFLLLFSVTAIESMFLVLALIAIEGSFHSLEILSAQYLNLYSGA